MAKDPESKQTPIIIAMEAGIIDPCMIAAMAHVEGATIGDALKHEGEVLFGEPEAAAPPVAKPEG